MTFITDQNTSANPSPADTPGAVPAPSEIYVLGAGHGHHLHFLNNLATLKTAAGGDASMAVVEFDGPRDFGPPLHRHHDEDEFFFILDGEIEVQLGDELSTVGQGAFVWLPCGLPHTVQLVSDSCRMLAVTAPAGGSARFDAMVAALGEDTTDVRIPDPMDIDPGHVAAVCAEHGIEIMGPPPAPRS